MNLKNWKGDDFLAEIAVNAKYKYKENINPPLSLLIKHIDYIAKLIGVDHVGLGADFDGAESYPHRMDDVSNYPLITKELLKLGYRKDAIEKILGGNLYSYIEIK